MLVEVEEGLGYVKQKFHLKLRGKLSNNCKTKDVVHNKVLTVKNQHKNKLNIEKMRMLCWMCDKTRRYMTRNKVIR